MKWLALALGLFAFAGTAKADVVRFALVVGNDEGAAGEPTLQYAEDDARNVADVMTELGGVPSENLVLAMGRTADQIRRSLISLNDRIRAADGDAILFVYYSGHADARALHLGRTRFDIEELRELVRGSAADFRVLVVDSCRSGSVTRAKGGRARRPFAIQMDPALSAEGVVFLTSSSIDEDAQESDALRGSIFTHYFVSALLGAGDENADGSVDVAEAYRYSYANTLRESTRSLGTLQHPTYRYDYGGHGALVLTMPGARVGRRGAVTVPAGRTVLLMRGDADGDVVAEVGMHDRARSLNLRAGRYFVVAREETHLLEGPLEVLAGQTVAIDTNQLSRVEYARLVRRGGGEISSASFLSLGYRLRTSIHDGDSLCHGASLSYGLDLSALTLGARLSGCRATFETDTVRGTSDELALSLRADRYLDLGPLSVFVGVEIGISGLRQSFETRGRAPSRLALAPSFGAHFGVSFDFTSEGFLFVEGAGMTTFVTLENAARQRELSPQFNVVGTAGFGLRF